MSEKYPVLKGLTASDNYRSVKELRGVEEVAKFICEEGIKCEGVVITTMDDKSLLCTNGIYLDKIIDLEYREALLKILIPMQEKTAMQVFAW